MNSLGLEKSIKLQINLKFKSLDGVSCNDEGILEFQNLFSDFYSVHDDLVEFALKNIAQILMRPYSNSQQALQFNTSAVPTIHTAQ